MYKMKKTPYFTAILLLTLLWYSCKKDQNNYIDPNAPAPAQVTDLKITSMPGGAVVTYKIPMDSNLAYVKATYEIQPGIFREAKSSYYTDTLALVGFGDTLSHEVKIYSVGRNEKESAPIAINVQPLTPPVRSVFETLKMTATFGGVNVSFENSSQADLAIVVIVDTTGLGTWAPVTTFYTSAQNGNFSARGFEPEEKKFAVYLRDHWNNKSDTLTELLTPLYEEMIPKPYYQLVLPNDATLLGPGNGTSVLWDGIYNDRNNLYASTHTEALPEWFTIDLGRKVILSRFKEYQRRDYPYNGSVAKTFEIWGSNDPDLNGGWDHWQLLGTFHSFKPSGLPFGQTNADDVNYAVVNGEDFEFTDALPAVRFIRFKTLETYGTDGQVVISELSFWGQIQP